MGLDLETALIYVIAITVMFALGFGLRFFANKYTNSKIALVMLAVEKKLSTWAKEQAASGADKRQEAIRLIAEKVYPFLPVYVKMFVTQDFLVSQIDKLYSEMLDFLDDGSFNDSIQ